MSRTRPRGQGTWKPPRPPSEIAKAAGVGIVVVLANVGLVWAFAPETHSSKPPTTATTPITPPVTAPAGATNPTTVTLAPNATPGSAAPNATAPTAPAGTTSATP